MATLGSLVMNMRLESAAFNRDMKKSAALLNTQTAKMRKSMRAVERETRNLSKSMGKLKVAASAFAGALAVRQFNQFAAAALKTADAIDKTSQKVGVAASELQKLRFAAEQNGVAQNTLDMALQRFSRRVGEAAQGSGELKDTLKQYGIAVKDSEGRTRATVDVLKDLANAIKGAGSEQEQLRIAFKAFDSEGAALVNLMRQGSDGMAAFTSQAEEFGLVMSDRVVKAAVVFNDNLNVLKRSFSNAFDTSIITGLAGSVELTAENLKTAQQIGQQFGQVVGASMRGIAATAKLVADNIGLIGGALAALIALKAAAIITSIAVAVTKLALAMRAAAATAGVFGAITAGLKKGLVGIAAAVAAFATMREAISSTDPAIKDAIDGLRAFGIRAERTAAPVRKLTGATKDQIEAIRQERDDMMELALALEHSEERYDAVKLRIDLTNRARSEGIKLTKEEGFAWLRTAREMEEYRDRLEAARRKQTEARKATEEHTAELERQAEAARDLALEPIRNAIQGVQRAFTDMFENIFSGGINSTEDFAEAMRGIFTRLAAEIATLMIVQPVIGQIGIGGAGGSPINFGGGVGGGGGSNPLNFAGGGGGFSSFGSFFSNFGTGFSNGTDGFFSSIGSGFSNAFTGLFGGASATGASTVVPAVPGVSGSAVTTTPLSDTGTLGGAGFGSGGGFGGGFNGAGFANFGVGALSTIITSQNSNNRAPITTSLAPYAAMFGPWGWLVAAGMTLKGFTVGRDPDSPLGVINTLMGPSPDEWLQDWRRSATTLANPTATALGDIIGDPTIATILNPTRAIFGTKTPSVGPNANARLGINNGEIIVTGFGADNGGEAGSAATFAEQIAEVMNLTIASIGGELVRGGDIGQVGNFPSRGGVFAAVGAGAAFGGETDAGLRSAFGGDAEEAVSFFVRNSLNDLIATGAIEGISQDLADVIQTAASLPTDFEEFLQDVALGQQILGEFGEAADSISAFDLAVQAVHDRFDELVETAERLNITNVKLSEARERELEAVRYAFREPYLDASAAIFQAVRGQFNQFASPATQLQTQQQIFGTLIDQVRGGDISQVQNLLTAAGNVITLGRQNFASGVSFANLEGFVQDSLLSVADRLASEEFFDEQVEAVRQQTTVLSDDLQDINAGIELLQREIRLLRQQVAA